VAAIWRAVGGNSGCDADVTGTIRLASAMWLGAISLRVDAGSRWGRARSVAVAGAEGREGLLDGLGAGKVSWPEARTEGTP